MKQQETNQEEPVQSGKQVAIRLIALLAGIVVIVIIYKMLLG
jgi:hypothetical protein